MVLGYEYQYRDGTESTTQWGPVSDGSQTRDIYPAFKDISEHVHILKFDLDYEADDARITDSFRGEWYSLATGQHNVSFDSLGAAEMATTTANEKQTYFQGANTVHLEKQFTDWLFASGGYLYSSFNGDASVDVTTMNPAFLSPPPTAPGWNATDIELERDSHVFSLSALLGPWEGLSLSLGSQNEWTHQTGFGNASVVDGATVRALHLPGGAGALSGEYRTLDRTARRPACVLRRFPLPPCSRKAASNRRLLARRNRRPATSRRSSSKRMLRAGWRTSARASTLRPGGAFRSAPNTTSMTHHTDYNNSRKESLGQPYDGYPGFILWRDLLSQEAEVKLSLQAASWLKTTLSYQWLENNYHTATDSVNDPLSGLVGGISPGGSLLAGNYQAQIATLNTTLTPWRRLFLSTTFSYQNARTVTAANDSPSVAPYEGNIYSVMASGSYVLNQKTDLTASYSALDRRFCPEQLRRWSAAGNQLSTAVVQVGIKRQIGKGKSLSLHYSFYHYDEPSSGGFNNFNAHAVFATLSFQIP